ncbi:ribosomal protein L7/L12 [Butyrivibrio sp. XPD2006]|uniref:ribosomal protein L7/L12 n=1 Tax=Butyrivibrio sp. XPD2006 TaxID=1280668 RepID=UPI0009DB7217|nr:ribosomal protein L7/L12 [Butyrivibrio sp. XPD2006]
MKCKNCGQPLMKGVNFCSNCGAPVPKKKSVLKPILIILLIAAILTGCIAGAIALLPKMGSKKKSTGSALGSINGRYEVMIPWKESGLQDHPMHFYSEDMKRAVYNSLKDLRGEFDEDKEIMLKDCYELRYLSVSGRIGQKEFDQLAELENLQNLTVTDAQIENISALASLKYLKEVHLSRNNIRDISPLKGLNELQTLRLSENPIEDYSPLLSMEGLQDLTLAYMKTPLDKKVIGNLGTVTTLNLSGNDLDEINFLTGCSALEALTVEANSIKDVSIVETFPNFFYLDADMNKITELPVLNDEYGIYSISVDYNYISNLSALKGSSLMSFSAAYNQISDISPLKEIGYTEDIDTIDLAGNRITDISALSDMNLTYLNLSDNRIKDLSPIIHMTHLYDLNIARTDIEGDFHMFGEELAGLRTLDIGGDKISSFDGIENLPALQEIRFDDMGISNLDLVINSETIDYIYGRDSASDAIKQQIKDNGKYYFDYVAGKDLFVITLKDVGDDDYEVMTAIDDTTDLGFSTARDLVDRGPCQILTTYSYDDARKLMDAVEMAGGVLSVSFSYDY